MRAVILALVLGFGLAAATSAVASACQYHASMASNDPSAPAQTAEAQPATDQATY